MGKRIGYLGPSGSFSEEACYRYIGKEKGWHLVGYTTIYDLILATQDQFLDECIVPIENAIEGAIGITVDLLARQDVLKIKREITLSIAHHLLAKKQLPLEKITDLISHPQAIAQCQGFIRKKLPGVRLHHAESTSHAAQFVARQKSTARYFVALANRRAAELYHLQILSKKNVSDFYVNETRFVVLAPTEAPPTTHDKTSIMFTTLRDQPGALYHILSEFAKRDINLTKIESRPSKRALGDYYFFVDLMGHQVEPKVKAALHAIAQKASSLKILGSYPMATKSL